MNMRFSSLFARLIPCVLATVFIARAEAEPNGRPPRIYLPGQPKLADKPVKIGMPSEVGFLRDTIYYARNAQSSDGATPAVFATISIVALEPSSSVGGKMPDRTKVWYAYGQLKPSVGVDALEGKLPLFSNSGDGAYPFSAGDNMTLGVVVKQNGRTSFHFQINGRNRLGKGPEEFQPETESDMLLTTTRNFSGQKSLVTISLSKSWIGKQAAPVAVEKKPIGVKYEVSAKFVITNSDDGADDNTVEARGSFYLNAWNYPNVTPGAGFLNVFGSFGAGNEIVMPQPMIVERIFSEPKTNRLKIEGKVYDYDAASSNDDLWDAPNVLLLNNIVQQGGKRVLKGDEDDESGDLVITVKKIADIF